MPFAPSLQLSAKMVLAPGTRLKFPWKTSSEVLKPKIIMVRLSVDLSLVSVPASPNPKIPTALFPTPCKIIPGGCWTWRLAMPGRSGQAV